MEMNFIVVFYLLGKREFSYNLLVSSILYENFLIFFGNKWIFLNQKNEIEILFFETYFFALSSITINVSMMAYFLSWLYSIHSSVQRFNNFVKILNIFISYPGHYHWADNVFLPHMLKGVPVRRCMFHFSWMVLNLEKRSCKENYFGIFIHKNIWKTGSKTALSVKIIQLTKLMYCIRAHTKWHLVNTHFIGIMICISFKWSILNEEKKKSSVGKLSITNRMKNRVRCVCVWCFLYVC